MSNNSQIDIATSISTQIYQYASIASLVIFTFGLMINLFLLYLLLFDNYFQNISYKLISVSVVSDIISTIASLSAYIEILRRNLDYNGSVMMCRTTFFFGLTSFTFSIMNLCVIGMDRYFAIVRSLSPFYRQYKRYIFISSELLVCLIAVSVNIPIFKYFGASPNDTMLCDVPLIADSKSTGAYLIAYVIISFIIPESVILTIYGRIIAFQKSYIRPGKFTKSQLLQQKIKNKRFIKTMVWISTSYILISWPFCASILGLAVTRKSIFMVRQTNIIEFLFLLASATITVSISILNPFIYFKFDSNIRRRSLLLLRQLRIFRCLERYGRIAPISSTRLRISNSGIEF